MNNQPAFTGHQIRCMRVQRLQANIGLIQTETDDLKEMSIEQLQALTKALKATYIDTLQNNMNPILVEVLKARKGHYCHCYEAETASDLECLAESICQEYEYKYTEATIITFLESLSIYATNDDTEDEVYSFSFTDYVKGSL